MAQIASFAVILLLVFCDHLIFARGHTATVMDYAKTKDDTLPDYNNLLMRTNDYMEHIKKSETNIIIFPEYGLTTFNLPENLEAISTFIPDESANVVPCTNSDGFAKHLIDLSCAAREHSTYTVVNLIEKANSTTNSTIYYNTNVVFDSTGKIIAKYRKINLCNEPMFTRGENISTFTAFDVKFGLMTSCDLMFQHSALTLINDNVTDIIYPHAWISETPFMHGLSLQDGFAKANGINLLSATYSNATAGMGGAAIFLADASIATMDISTAISASRNAATIPRITARTPEKVCTNNIEISPRLGGQLPGIEQFMTRTENMDLYTISDLESVSQNESKAQVCSEGSSFCCDFYIKFQTQPADRSVYKVAAFYGTKRVNGTSQTLGFRTCALVACRNNDRNTCGQTLSNINTLFDSITIKSNLPKSNGTFYMPSTLGNDLKPIKGYAYCQNEVDGAIATTMSINNVNNLLTFGIFGRVYDLDGQAEGTGSGTYIHCAFALLITSLLSHLLMQ